MVTPVIVQVCIGFHFVCTLTPQIVRLHVDVCCSHAGYFTWMSCILGVVRFVGKWQCFILNYMFEVLPGSRLL